MTTTPTEKVEAQPADPDKALAASFHYQPMMQVGGQDGLKGLLAAMKGRIAAALPKHLTPDRILKAALTAVIRTPKLLQCTQESFCESLMRASQLGLDCSGTLGSAYLVPFYNGTKKVTECQLIPGYRGLIDLARRSNEISSIEAHAVYAQDSFSMKYGTTPEIVHVPYLRSDRREEFVCFYAIGTLKDGSKQIEVMTLADVKKIQGMSKMGDRGPWVEHFSEMARKTVVRRICKYLPMSTELEKALEYDNEVEGFDIQTIDVSALENMNRTEDLTNRLAGEPGQDSPKEAESAEKTDTSQTPRRKKAKGQGELLPEGGQAASGSK